ncbi:MULTISPECIES: DNA mismatch repair endonuclease MutL [unclassified Vibrio]|uniref:DNA mismatch repair endonuclease MutL n=1 Tax=unclassified Vibrio TaxID=2614977 RepID=UPI000C827E0C|nr:MULTISPECIES: DNA mismatch repair endonuclease MutL [unclassified Vibrio]PMI23732.1 DNA mismatch repair protein MutL [Vibrio sp. 10N.286.46.E10]PMI99238.1 DNA mismatch repair protein MutL [Vibrio sp. 10N.286.45.E10]PTO96300.1 DNA mismatch repair endonuclease MutL [Vibrio sp. 10N.286.48.B8]PTO96809.1 DNA mismatch repair endonuclease MutL [Vibrio sp. 10N.286.45.A3]PTQ22168.1 DNA mismatch repair endonuclease MutL [Vibrio sp. 10N.286.46.E10]
MTIKILPARLANQIAAGEVVERPASVVKELVENSLDSGATRIDIDIEKGGAKMIRVRDNGKGIVKDELALALSRHATSKIHTLDDLEAIVSLGFRGEALASISSVARLTMTSRPATQDQAWAAHSEGRDMQVKLQPAAHPIGTSVEVLDLFFNTPARRKFLRTEKTEFTHIDELLKRIALSRFDVTINLRHNGKMIRQYRAAKTQVQAEKRIAAVCGNPFVRHMLKIELEHQGLKLHGWITTPEGARQQSDLQYCYVNGRMMRDKLINHAIRQSYETSLRPDQFATYVLFIELDPHQVDVNVHPAKHEVRFHQARLVHDFIYQALSDGLAQSKQIDAAPINQSAFHQSEAPNYQQNSSVPEVEETTSFSASVSDAPAHSEQSQVSERVRHAIEQTPAYPRKAESEQVYDNSQHSVNDGGQHYSSPENRGSSSSRSSSTNLDSSTKMSSASTGSSARETSFTGSPRQEWIESRPVPRKEKEPNQHHAEPAPSKREVKAYKELLKTPDFDEHTVDLTPPQEQVAQTAPTEAKPAQQNPVNSKPRAPVTDLGKAVSIVERQYLVMGNKNGSVLVSLAKAELLRVVGQLDTRGGALKSQPLLVPLSIKLGSELVEVAKALSQTLALLGIELKARNSEAVMVMGVPSPLRQQNLQILIPDLLSYAASLNAQIVDNHSANVSSDLLPSLVNWIGIQTAQVKSDYTLSEAVQLVGELEQLWHGLLPLDDPEFVNPIDFSATIAAFTV